MGQCPCDKSPPKNYQLNTNNNFDHINYNNNINNIHNKKVKYDYDLNKEKYIIQKDNEKTHYINININDNTKITDITNLNRKYNDIKLKNKIFYDDIEEQESYIENYRGFISELNYQINNLKDHLKISLVAEKFYENLLNKEENNELLNNIENISNKIDEFDDLIEKQKIELKNLENNFQIIQEQFNEIKKNSKNDPTLQNNTHSINIESIKEQLEKSENILKKLQKNKYIYENKKNEIEFDIKNIQDKTEKKVTSIKKRRKKNLSKNFYSNKHNNNINKINDSLFLKGSMLFGIKDFRKAESIFKSMYIFKEDKTNEDAFYEKQNLVKKNWHETCYINDDYDIHEINYELKAVGLPEDMCFTSGSFEFPINTHIEIILFEIDGKATKYELEKYSLRFEINLTNLQSCNIHIIYKETLLIEKMTQAQREIKSIYFSKIYGISKRLVGQNAKYILINASNYEIINFDEEFFIKSEKSDRSEYHWGGKVPENGKQTIVKLSKKEGHVNFYEKHVMKTIDNSLIKNTVSTIPFCYFDGNNKILNYSYGSRQTQNIRLDQTKKIFEVKYINTNSPIGEFTIKGKLINRCKGEWIINLTNEEIESLIPPDYKSNKESFKKISLEIIKKYDEEHKDDLVVVPNVTKIGKWVKKNIKYDLTYVGLNDITATETYNSRKGVCHHITKLFNAFMYSLGYQSLYILGYAIDKKKSFAIEDSHAWSLIKIDGKWLPFDATWGIFSGKLPVTHIFKHPDCKGKQTLTYDKIKIEQINVKGSIN